MKELLKVWTVLFSGQEVALISCEQALISKELRKGQNPQSSRISTDRWSAFFSQYLHFASFRFYVPWRNDLARIINLFFQKAISRPNCQHNSTEVHKRFCNEIWNWANSPCLMFFCEFRIGLEIKVGSDFFYSLQWSADVLVLLRWFTD